MIQPARAEEQNGFVGAVSGMSLADIVQVKGTNRYSGCLVVEHQGKSGMVFFRDGEIIHAEQGDLMGEDAFYFIMGWFGGTFRSEPKLATTSKTIEKTLGFLVLEALRRLDESKKHLKSTVRADARTVREGGSMSDISNRLSAISGVEHAVVITKEGQVVDDSSYKAEILGGHGLYLAIFAGHIASQLGAGALKSVIVQGTDHHLLLFDSKRHHLCIAAEGNSQVNILESEIRKIMSEK